MRRDVDQYPIWYIFKTLFQVNSEKSPYCRDKNLSAADYNVLNMSADIADLVVEAADSAS